MSAPSLPALDKAIRQATQAGSLHAIRTGQTFIEDQGIRFLVRWASSLIAKDAAQQASAAVHPPPNPFLPPEPALTLGPIGTEHLLVLNKYPVIHRHLLIITRRFEEQTAPLQSSDFDALARVMQPLGGLGFYNGGSEAGASQRHKHLQWIPESPQSDCLRSMTAALPQEAAPASVLHHPLLNWQHAFVRLDGSRSSAMLEHAFRLAADRCALHPSQGQLPAYNLLANDAWMLLVPRRSESSAGVQLNALGFAGSIFVRKPEEIELIRRTGPLNMLASVACENGRQHAATPG